MRLSANPNNLILSVDTKTESGSASCPGFVGLTVGSGVGRYTGLFGLLSDALLSARVVTADGRVLQVSEKENSDLFWGMRGAGANLGIITSATYQAHKLVNQGQVMNADMIFPANMSKQYFDVLGSFSGKMPANLAVITIIYYDTTAQAVSRVPFILTWFSICFQLWTKNDPQDADPRELGVHRPQRGGSPSYCSSHGSQTPQRQCSSRTME